MKTTTSFVGLLGLATFAVAAPVDDVRRALREPRAAAPYPIVSGPYGYGGYSSSGNAVGPVQTSGTGIVGPVQTAGPTGTGVVGPISTGVLPPTTVFPTGTAPVGPISTGVTSVVTETVTSATTTTTSSSAVVTTTTTSSTTSSSAAPPASTGSCSPDGEFFCSPDGLSYALCNFGAYVYQPVAPGTLCINDLIVHQGDGPCPAGLADGQLVCRGTDEYALCDFGRVQFQPVAPGTQCIDGAIV